MSKYTSNGFKSVTAAALSEAAAAVAKYHPTPEAVTGQGEPIWDSIQTAPTADAALALASFIKSRWPADAESAALYFGAIERANALDALEDAQHAHDRAVNREQYNRATIIAKADDRRAEECRALVHNLATVARIGDGL